ncbi:hypothetical protein JZ751_026758 [Albula glossodonta]|uniref:Uncharacterized protein n=1 Tax=Albula glossodonta TaxID=121402 RepID=A0A8T2PLA3_9TELE|nr:hypothetical protein JZ751_026758 [Albula glossodonta]
MTCRSWLSSSNLRSRSFLSAPSLSLSRAILLLWISSSSRRMAISSSRRRCSASERFSRKLTPRVYLKTLILQGRGDDPAHSGPDPARLLGGKRVLSDHFPQQHDVVAGRETYLPLAGGGGGASNRETCRVSGLHKHGEKFREKAASEPERGE